ncbi:MAG: rRNA maturation RNase YbeY [Cytophagaceae bacterium]|nr:rRNA maturation RNase YbeY [Cytophagaceae bacterium]MDW8456594.1 rRNA maturation RNase YbeY [Cytophagaceae bacterium]
MASTNILFFSEDISFALRNKNKHREWLKKIAQKEKHVPGALNYIFCSDEYLYKINFEYLKHDTYTDVITFDLRENNESNILEADIYISIERVKENARQLKLPLYSELRRVMIHALLHLVGYTDKSEKEKIIMRSKETEALQFFEKMK